VNSTNNDAWRLATDPDPSRRNPDEAVRLARLALALSPDDANFLNTLGVAQYRAGNLPAAIAALERSDRLRPASAHNAFFLAMAQARLGHHELAQQWYRKAGEWARRKQSASEISELTRFREEAAAVLEVTRGMASNVRAHEEEPPGGSQGKAGPRSE
jgi:tetratricopeptide (TPR) repeat protein